MNQEEILIAMVDTLESTTKPILERIDSLEREIVKLRKIAQKNEGMIQELYQAMASGYLK